MESADPRTGRRAVVRASRPFTVREPSLEHPRRASGREKRSARDIKALFQTEREYSRRSWILPSRDRGPPMPSRRSGASLDHSSSRTNPAPPSSNPGRRIPRANARVRSRYRFGFPPRSDDPSPSPSPAPPPPSPSRRIAARHPCSPSLASSASRYDAYPPRPTSAGDLRPPPTRSTRRARGGGSGRERRLRGARRTFWHARRVGSVVATFHGRMRVSLYPGDTLGTKRRLRAAASSDKTASSSRSSRRRRAPGRAVASDLLRRIRPSRSARRPRG